MKRVLIILGVVSLILGITLTLTSTAFAHGRRGGNCENKVVGEVSSVSEAELVVESEDEEAVLALTEDTKYCLSRKNRLTAEEFAAYYDEAVANEETVTVCVRTSDEEGTLTALGVRVKSGECRRGGDGDCEGRGRRGSCEDDDCEGRGRRGSCEDDDCEGRGRRGSCGDDEEIVEE